MKKQSNNLSREENLQEIKDTAQRGGGIKEKILNVLPVGVSITSSNGYYTYVNPRFCQIYGYEREELIGNHFSMVVPDEMKDKRNYLHNEFIEGNYEMYGELEVKRKGGEKFTVLVNAAYLEDEDNGEAQQMTFLVDTESLSLSNDNLNATVEMLKRKIDAQELAFHISNHDMRNNIGNISQLAELLRSTELDDKQNKYVDIIHQLSVRTLNMLKMSSDYLKMEKGNYQPHYTEFDLLQALANEIGAFSKEAENRGIAFYTVFNEKEVLLQDDSLIVHADKMYIERMFGNLIGNAVEASPDNGEINVNIESGEKLKVSIHNRGAIPVKIWDRFFDKFTTAGKDEGTGLGTYIAKLVTDLHNGSIDFKTSEEEGTTIFVELPGDIVQQ